MKANLDGLNAFAAVARAKGFREAARSSNSSPSGMSEAIRRLESQLGVRLLHRTTRSVALTEAGQRLLDRLGPALTEVDAALDSLNSFRDTPAGTLRLNVPLSTARLVLPEIVPAFLAAHPGIKLEIIAEQRLVNLVEEGCDAGVRYGENLEQDMIAIPFGPREQRLATAASPAYLAKHGRPRHPRDLLAHSCVRGRSSSGSPLAWEFERAGKTITVEPPGPLVVSLSASDLAVEAGLAGVGIVRLFEAWLAPHFESCALEPVLKPWWQRFPGPFLYYPGRRLVPGPLRAFINFIQKRR